MTLENWLEYLSSRCASRIDLGLDRIEMVYHSLMPKELLCPTILVAGTNGKGSVLQVLDSVYREAGYRVGLYTSPHLFDFRERFRVNGELLSEAQWVNAFSRIDQQAHSKTLTFFEFTTLAALLLSSEARLDVLLLEVGMGGRLDATNIVPRSLSVITSIAMDHMAYLGETREAIAREKAGIIHSGVPVVVGDPTVPAVIAELAHSCDAPFRLLGERWSIYQPIDDTTALTYVPELGEALMFSFPLGVLPSNVGTALAVLESLSDDLPVSDLHKQQGLLSMQLVARQQRLHYRGIRVMLDVAHNPQSVESLVEQAMREHPGGRVRCVFSVLQGKDLAGMLAPLKVCDPAYYVFELSGERAIPLAELCDVIQQEQPGSNYQAGQLSDLWLQLWEDVQPDDSILIFGSFQVVAALQPYLRQTA